MKYVASNPVESYDLPVKSTDRGRAFTDAEMQSLLAVPQFSSIATFFVQTGLRSGEYCWLMKEDLINDGGAVHIRAKTCPLTGERWRPKGGKDRIVPLPAEAAAIAREAQRASPGPWLFVNPEAQARRGGRYDSQYLLRLLRDALAAASITDGTIHSFRHTYCTRMANAGVSAFELMALMGHSNISIVLTYYSKSDEGLAKTVKGVDFTFTTDDRKAG